MPQIQTKETLTKQIQTRKIEKKIQTQWTRQSQPSSSLACRAILASDCAAAFGLQSGRR